MSIARPLLLSVALAAAVPCSLPSPARAAESYDSCVGYIDALPAVITTQGVWCLRADLSAALETGTAIDVNTNNVTIDCNGYKIGNLQASSTNIAFGIDASGRANLAVRGCNLRGFGYAIYVSGGGGGHLIESNRIVASRQVGIYLSGDGSMIRDNQVTDTVNSSFAAGIITFDNIDVLDNVVDTVDGGAADVYGIYLVQHESPAVRRNHVRNVMPPEPGFDSAAIFVADGTSQALVSDNYVASGITAVADTVGIGCTDVDVIVRGNSIIGFETGLDCTNGGSNVVR